MPSKDTKATIYSIWLLFILTFLPGLCYSTNYDGVILGDSISSGYGVTQTQNWVYVWQQSLTCHPKISNISVQGATTADGLDNLIYFYQQHQAKWMILELGGNDGLRGLNLDAMQNRLEKMIQLARSKRTDIYLVSTDLPANYGETYRKQFKSKFEELAKRYNLNHISLFFPSDQALIQSDGIHPSPKGHALIADAMRPLSDIICKIDN
jgi:acyl-CoA thioesterase-1